LFFLKKKIFNILSLPLAHRHALCFKLNFYGSNMALQDVPYY